MEMPKPIQISPEATKKLRQLEEKKRAISQLVQMMTQQGEQQIQAYNQAAKEVWGEIEKETKVDLVNIIWVPHQTENKIVPVQIILGANQPWAK